MTIDTLLASLEERGIDIRLVGCRVRISHWRALTSDELKFIRTHRAEVRAALKRRAGAGRASASEPDPVVWTVDYARRITQADVDTAVADQVSHGACFTTKREAFEFARAWLAERAKEQRDEELIPLMQRYAAKEHQ